MEEKEQTKTPVTEVNQQKKEDTYSHRGWIMSDKFLKRAFAVWGYYFIANIILSIIIGLVVLVLAVTLGVSLPAGH